MALKSCPKSNKSPNLVTLVMKWKEVLLGWKLTKQISELCSYDTLELCSLIG